MFHAFLPLRRSLLSCVHHHGAYLPPDTVRIALLYENMIALFKSSTRLSNWSGVTKLVEDISEILASNMLLYMVQSVRQEFLKRVREAELKSNLIYQWSDREALFDTCQPLVLQVWCQPKMKHNPCRGCHESSRALLIYQSLVP